MNTAPGSAPRIIGPLLAAALLLSGCTVEGPRTSEPAVVEDLVFSPASHSSGLGFTGSGDVAFVEQDGEATYSVVFRCAHGRFVVGGPDEEHERLWKRLEKGERVVVDFAPLRDRQGRPRGFRFYGVQAVNAGTL